MRREAAEEADQIRTGALAYSNDVLTEVERVLSAAYESAASKYDGFIGTLKNNLDIINNNKRELSDQLYPQQSAAAENGQDMAGTDNTDGDFDFDENAFLDQDK
jgi:hypothetical protein